MLYPDFNELVGLKNRNGGKVSSSLKNVTSSLTGGHFSSFRGQGLEFDAVREYVPGDDIRNIDWRVTARTGKPHLKIFKEERERQRMLVVDMNASMRFGTRGTFKSVQAARVAAWLGWQGLAHHDRVSGCFFGDVPEGIQFFAPNRTRKSFSAMLKALSDPPVHEKDVLFDALLHPLSQAVSTGSLVYVISDFMNLDELENISFLSRLNSASNIVFISINDPADKNLFSAGSLGFFNGIEKFWVNTSHSMGRQAYQAEWEKSRLKLTQLASRFKIPLIELTTESDIHRELTLGLKFLGRKS